MASIITPSAFELAQKLNFNRYKIASRTVVDHPKLCEEIISSGKEVFCSLGFWEGVEFPFGAPNSKLRYIHCVSNYPNTPEDLRKMPPNFSEKSYFGYSDHFLGNSASYVAISRGAKFIEKHLTLNKASQSIRDHTLSITPDEFRELVDIGRDFKNSSIYRKKLTVYAISNHCIRLAVLFIFKKMKDSEIKNFSLLPVTILSSFGHNGLDWIHSLLDGHDEIVLMPAYSFRTLDFYEKEKGKNLIENQKRRSISKEFTEYVFNNPSYQVEESFYLARKMLKHLNFI